MADSGNNPPIGGAPVGSGSNDTPVSPPKYVPQFSATTEMILKRISSGATSSLSSIGITGMPPGYEDMRRNILQGMKTSMNMEIPSTPVGGRRAKAAAGTTSARATPPTGSAKGKASAKPKSRAGTKRKRAKDESESEEEEESEGNMSKLGGDSESEDSVEVTELPKMTQSGRQVVKPAQFVPPAHEPSTKRRASSKRSQEQALCKRCGRGHSPQNNQIVFCDGCNHGWHQQCHDPTVSDEAVQDEESPWFCADCSRKRGIKSGYEPTPKGVSWAGKSTEEKRTYLSSLPHPQLVTLLLQATSLHPNLPIFPAPAPTIKRAPTNSLVNNPFPPSATSTAGLFSRYEANPSAPMNYIRKIQSPVASSLSLPRQSQQHASSAPPTLPAQNGEGSRESTPASPPYPKAGNGLMAKLGRDDEDLEWLVDNADFEAFSHTVYNNTASNAAAVGGPQEVATVNGKGNSTGVGGGGA